MNTLQDNDEVVITNNGRPAVLMLDIKDANFEETLKAVRQAKAIGPERQKASGTISLTFGTQYGTKILGGKTMIFFAARDLRTRPKMIWDALQNNGEVVITNNGHPAALMLDIKDGGFEETLKAVRQAKAMIAFNSMRKKAAERGFMSDEEIESEITASRREQRER